MEEKLVHWFEEIGKEYNDVVGKKCANLGEMTRMGLPVPPGFAISIEFYRRFLRESGAGDEMARYVEKMGDLKGRGIEVFEEMSRTLQGIIQERKMPSHLKELIIRYYEDLCQRVGIPELAVSVRSAGTESRPGMFDTYLNVKGAEEVVRHVKKVWASAFTPRAIAFRVSKEIPILGDELGVGVVKMVRAKASGIGFTVDPVTGDTSKIIIEANWGLGEGVVSGAENVDKFMLDKGTLQILERTVGKKSKCVAMKEMGAEWIEVPREKQDIPCLNDDEILEVAKLAKHLEERFGRPQDMEWAIDEEMSFPEGLFLLQTRPAKFRSVSDQIAEKITELFRDLDLSKAVDRLKDIQFKF